MEIVRETFVDRTLSASDLVALADMLRRWFLANAIDAEHSGEFQIEAWICAVPEQRRRELIRSLSSRVPEAQFDDADPDHIAVLDPAEPFEYPSQITLWRELLASPEIKQNCLILRMTFRGVVKNLRKHPERSATTFVLCGAPAGDAFLLKAAWTEGLDRGMVMAHHFAVWAHETRLLSAFDLYLEQSTSGTRDEAARRAYEHFRSECRKLFPSQGDERRVMRLVRAQVEMMDERGPAAFVRRLGVPLLAFAALATLTAFLFIKDLPLALPSALGALWMFSRAVRIAWMKFQRMRRYRNRMRKNLATIYSAPTEYIPVDLSGDENPTLVKYSAELADLGCRHICDLKYKTARRTGDGGRYYVVDNAFVVMSHLRQTEKHLFFPARPVLIISTEFRDGSRHYTVNQPEYRKSSRPAFSRRCVLNTGGAAEVLAAHRRHVEKLLAAGALPRAPPLTQAALIELLCQRNQEARESPKNSRCSWGDAMHEAFKVCRREYLVD
ncbi:MAG TPA: hypothetical protein VGP63_10625 [Planctomycetaceae bacterium]|jgi:hypothetical protein|nr:hypothetical protein [Planctomycetaceae bacterium]